jgi:ABC-type molybdate transport system substrate-binding protein
MMIISRTFRRHTGLAVPALVAALAAFAGPAAAADIYVLSDAAMQSVFNEIVGDFERMTEHKVAIRYANLRAAITRTLPDERADLIIGSRQLISDLVRQGRMRPDIQLTICKIGAGVVVSPDTANAPMTAIESQNHTVISAGIPKDAPESEAVSAFLAFLFSAKAAAVMKAKGMNTD